MRLVDVTYYQFYHFYETVLKLKDSHFATVLAISEIVTLPLLLIIFFTLAINYEYIMPAYVFLGLDAISIIPFYNYFIKKKRGESIVRKKPLLFGNRFISLCFSWLIHIILFFILLTIFKYSYLLDFSK